MKSELSYVKLKHYLLKISSMVSSSAIHSLDLTNKLNVLKYLIFSLHPLLLKDLLP